MLKSQPFLSDKDLEKILNAPVKSHPEQVFKTNTLIRLLWDSGCRISEAVSLKVEDFDFNEKFLTFRNTKNHEDRIVPVTDKMAGDLKRLIGKRKGYIFEGREGHLTRSAAWQSLKLRVRLSGIDKNIRLHTFRHHFITTKLDKGIPLFRVQKFVGHRSTQSTGNYYHFTQEDLRSVLNS